MNKLILLFSLISLISSCAKIETLGLKTHSYGITPRQVIWFQIAGLSPEHLASIRFSYQDANQKTPLEMSSCVGLFWDYNLYNLRPKASLGFLSQITGRKNIKNNCDGLAQTPIWLEKNFNSEVAILENGVSEQDSFEEALRCEGANSFLQGTTLLKMTKPKNGYPLFHFQDIDLKLVPGVYYDKTCSDFGCYATLQNNINSFYTKYSENHKLSMYIIRDFTYQNALANRNIARSREILSELLSSLKNFQNLQSNDREILILVTSSEASSFEFPKEGAEWKEYELKSNFIRYHNSSLLSYAWAKGASAENFCGMLEESEISSRMFWRPPEKEFNFRQFFRELWK